MPFKLTGAILIILGCGGVGFGMAAAHRVEIRALREFIWILDVMEAELSFRLTPLPLLCRSIADKSSLFRNPLLDFAISIESQISPDPEACMNAVLPKYSSLPNSAKRCLREFGLIMGLFDLSGQLKQLEALRDHCQRDLDGLENNKEMRFRCYQALGLCVGAALAILLI